MLSAPIVAQNTFPSSGNVGIGTAGPAYALDIQNAGSTGQQLIIRLTGTQSNGYTQLQYNGTGRQWQTGVGNANETGLGVANKYYLFDQNGQAMRMVVDTVGNVGIGTTAPAFRLDVSGAIRATGAINASGGVTFPDGSTQTTAYNPALCGGDYAESVEVSSDRPRYEPGDVLIIDPNSPGKFLKSNEAYSHLVAGVYSTKPGFTGRRQTTPKSPDEIPMAMVGIVPTKVSAENGPIRVGDLLVASSAAGYAMKGTDESRLTGAVIGKALGSLADGTGVIEVLVTLQ